MRSNNPRASAAALLGLLATASVPVALLLSHEKTGVTLLDSLWSIPFALVLGVAALLVARGARARFRVSLERAGGGRLRAAVILGVAGICCAASGSIALGFYELLLHLEGS